MNWRKSYQREKELSERETKYQNQTDLMKNIVQTESGEIVEIINGTLVCVDNKKNWLTIAEWFSVSLINGATIKVSGRYLHVDFPQSIPTYKMESLLEHFTYQK